MRQQRIKVINEDTEALNKQISYKQKRLEQAEVMKKYDQCDTISKELQELKRRTLESELSLYNRKERRAQAYQQKKKVKKGSKSKPISASELSTYSSDESGLCYISKINSKLTD